MSAALFHTVLGVAMRCLLLALLLPTLRAQAPAHADRADADRAFLEAADAARTLGADTTRPTVHEFVDYVCPSCARYHAAYGDSLKALAAAGRANVVFRTAPIPRLLRGPHAAEAAFCAGGLGGADAFRALHDRLLARQDDWSWKRDPTDDFTAYAVAAGIEANAFRACLANDRTAPLVAADLRRAGRFGVAGTPTVVVTRPPSDEVVDLAYEPSMAWLDARLGRANEPTPHWALSALVGTWRVDSLAVYTWAVSTDALEARRADTADRIRQTLAQLRAGTLAIETTWASDETYTHTLRTPGTATPRYTETGTWRLDLRTAPTLYGTSTEGRGSPFDRARLLHLTSGQLILEVTFQTGDAAGLGERLYLVRQP